VVLTSIGIGIIVSGRKGRIYDDADVVIAGARAYDTMMPMICGRVESRRSRGPWLGDNKKIYELVIMQRYC
jgi:hypothetical protein